MLLGILIHTSVKLVTNGDQSPQTHRWDFNPHEREARDRETVYFAVEDDSILIHTSVKLVTVDVLRRGDFAIKILIHTSVKLVTQAVGISRL